MNWSMRAREEKMDKEKRWRKSRYTFQTNESLERIDTEWTKQQNKDNFIFSLFGMFGIFFCGIELKICGAIVICLSALRHLQLRGWF